MPPTSALIQKDGRREREERGQNQKNMMYLTWNTDCFYENDGETEFSYEILKLILRDFHLGE